MHAWRTILTEMTALTLAIGAAGAAVAQSEEDRTEVPAGVVIEATWLGRPADGEVTLVPDAAYHQVYDRVIVERWDATDPRLSGDATYRGMRHEYPGLGYFLESFEQTLVNDAGSWVGTGSGVASRNDDAEYGDVGTMTLHGTGAYEGLTAYLTSAFAFDSVDYYTSRLRGLIIEDELPPLPETLPSS